MNSFSQTDTTKVKIDTPIAKLVVKDLIKGDGCVEELKLTQEKVIKLEARETQKDTIISLLEQKDKNNQYIISQQGLQIDERTKTFLWKVGTFAGILTTSYLLIK